MQALLEWVSNHSQYAVFAVFFVSILESLAVVGIAVPGMWFLLSVGTLIGIGTLSFWPMFAAASLGAFVGDGLSFWLGRHFNQNLRHIWPLPKYPGLLKMGEDFFHRHGAMSVLFGRFVGPLRAIVPAVAGMMKMDPRRFLLFNIISALAWAPVVLLPGAVLGATLAQASAVAMRFGLLIFVIGLAFWMLGWLINHLYYRFIASRLVSISQAQVLRIITHVVVYSGVVAMVFLYQLKPPVFPEKAQLQNLSHQLESDPAEIKAQWRQFADQGFHLFGRGDYKAIKAGLQTLGWRTAETWSLASAFAWISDDADLTQLVFSDPRLDLYNLALNKSVWVKAENAKRIWLFQVWSVPETESSGSRIMLGQVKRFTVYDWLLGFRYFVQDNVNPAEQRAFFATTNLLPAVLVNSLRAPLLGEDVIFFVLNTP